MNNLRFTFNRRTKMLTLRDGRRMAAEAKLLDLGGLGAWIGYVQVEESRRRQGYGRLLIGECVRRARESGCEGIGLHVGVTNDPAISLYRATGFFVAAITAKNDYYLMAQHLRTPQ